MVLAIIVWMVDWSIHSHKKVTMEAGIQWEDNGSLG